MAGLGTQSAIERADLDTPRLRMRAPRFYPNNLLVRIWRGLGVGDCPGLLYSPIFELTSDNEEGSIGRVAEHGPTRRLGQRRPRYR
jgi:hypothetical protein